MNTSQQLVSATRINRIRAQGYLNFTDAEVSSFAFGNRFAYIVCGSIVAIGVATASIPVLATITLVAFLGVVLPRHPFDYIYNNVLRSRLQKPELPPRSIQLKFACTIATSWLITTTSLFYLGHATAGYVVGSLLVSVALLLVTTDFCIPSAIYNYLLKVQV